MIKIPGNFNLGKNRILKSPKKNNLKRVMINVALGGASEFL